MASTALYPTLDWSGNVFLAREYRASSGFVGNLTGNVTGGITGPWKPTVNAAVAAAGTDLATAAQLSEGFTRVTGANGTVGVKLPATPTPGTIVIIKGGTSGILKIWPDAAATINAISSNGAYSTANGLIPLILIAETATQWWTIPLVGS